METEIKKGSKWIIIVPAVIAAAVLALILAFFLPAQTNAKKLEKQLKLGDKYLSELEYEQAVAAYQLALDIDPKSVEAYLGMAEAYIGMNDPAEALRALQKGYDLTQDERIAEKIRELESILNPVKEEEQDTEEEEVSDGMHHEFDDIDGVWDYCEASPHQYSYGFSRSRLNEVYMPVIMRLEEGKKADFTVLSRKTSL